MGSKVIQGSVWVNQRAIAQKCPEPPNVANVALRPYSRKINKLVRKIIVYFVIVLIISIAALIIITIKKYLKIN